MEIGTCAWCIDDTVGECGAHMYTQMLFAKTVFTRAIVCFSGLMSAIGRRIGESGRIHCVRHKWWWERRTKQAIERTSSERECARIVDCVRALFFYSLVVLLFFLLINFVQKWQWNEFRDLNPVLELHKFTSWFHSFVQQLAQAINSTSLMLKALPITTTSF